MNPSAYRGSFLVLFWMAIATGLGCSGADPPFEELPLRDALTASPEAIAALPPEAQRELATRLEEARASQFDADTAPPGPNPTPAGEVRAFDAIRELRGDDILVVSTLERGRNGLSRQPFPGELRRDPGLTLPPLEGPLEAATADAEESALDGRAGIVLGELIKSSGASRLVRVSEWPAGAVAMDDVVYVNASWLVALSSLDPRDPAKKSAGPPIYRPMSVGGNPYLTYGSLAACTTDVSQRCESCLKSGGCDPRPTLADFANGEEECRFLAEDPARPRQLCALALLSIGTVSACVRDGAPSCSLPSVTNTSSELSVAIAFLSEDRCVQALETCLSGGSPDQGGGSNTNIDLHVSTDGCQNPFTACASAFTSLNDSCKSRSCTGSGNQSCTSCSSCKSTNTGNSCGSCGSGGSTGSSSSSSGTGSGTTTGSGSGTTTGSGSGTTTGSGSGSGAGGSGSGTASSGSGGGSSSGSGGGSGGGSSSCGSCNTGSCSSCKGCGGSSSGSSSACKCQTEQSPVEPIGDAAWLLAPLAYVFRRARRLS